MAGRFTGDPASVSARMRLIRSTGTKPELALFSLLSEAGIRYQPYVKVDGITVDALVKRRVVIFVDSPFWHLRNSRDLSRLSTYWQARLLKNKRRDREQVRRLRRDDYIVVRLWADQLDRQRVLRRLTLAISELAPSVVARRPTGGRRSPARRAKFQ
jgi:DNA mismatch endonuclease (patch repair protein)